MCGIFGIIKQSSDENLTEPLATMSGAIQSRGPDHSGFYQDQFIGLGVNRLSIIDLESGNQPITNEDGTLVIVYNGELYNHPKLKSHLQAKGHVFKSNSDAETVLHAFEEYGPGCLKHFNGMFAFAIWNKSKKLLFMARDPLGIKPLYLTTSGKGLAFSSEAKALLPLVANGIKPDWTSLGRFFFFGYVPSPDSPFENIEKIPPAHYAWFNEGHLKLKRYWKPEYGSNTSDDFKQAKVKVTELLEKTVALELMSDVPVGIFLSGGLDSSSIAAFAQKQYQGKMHSFALSFEEKTHDESSDARLVANSLGLQHHELLFTQEMLRETLLKVANTLDEPFGDATVLPLYVLSNFARQHVKTVLTGWGGDEIFAGYPTYAAHNLARFYRKLPTLLLNYIIPSLVRRLPISSKYMSFEFKAKRFIRGVNMPPEIQHFLWMGYFSEPQMQQLFTENIWLQIKDNTLTPIYQAMEDMPAKDLLDRILYLDGRFFLEGNGLFQADRITMANSLEARVPLLNIELLEYVNTLPMEIKMSQGKTKQLLRSLLNGLLPKSILKKAKKGFGPPSSVWTKGVLSGIFEQVFMREKVESDGIFRHDEIQRLIKEHKSGKIDHGRNLWLLLSFQLWYDKFIHSRLTIN